MFCALVGVYALALGVSFQDKQERVGRPDVGWLVDDRNAISPSRDDASDLGLRGGGRALAVNGVELDPEQFEWASERHLNREIGASNTIRFQQGDQTYELSIPVRAWEWPDALFAHGAIDLLALLFMGTALAAFVLRPYEATTWALLSCAAVLGGLLTLVLVPISQSTPFREIFLLALVGFMSPSLLHAALAVPVVHPMLLRSRGPLGVMYGAGLLVSVVNVAGWWTGYSGGFEYVQMANASMFMAVMLFFVLRCAVLALRSEDRLIVQRARILLVGALVGGAPATTAVFLRSTIFTPAFDIRFAYWGLSLLFLPMGYLAVRHSLVNAGAAVRRAVAYAAVAGSLTALAVLLIAVQAYAVALLFFPFLYWWPRFDRRLTAAIYPKRSRFPQLLQQLGAELASSRTEPELLKVLASAPGRLCDARSGVAFLLPGVAGPDEIVLTADGAPLEANGTLASETLVKLVETTRKEIRRDEIAVEAQYRNIQADCYAGLDRLDADVILPILRDGAVIGALAAGPRALGDAYESPEIFALMTATQEAVYALSRVDALRQLRDRETEFQELKRYFPPQIVDRVMERGGASELRSKRKVVTVFFADLRGFTAFSERSEPEEVMATLAEYHEAMGKRIAEYAGTLERFAGDGFMVFFNDPVSQPDHVERAVRMALAMEGDVAVVRHRWQSRGYDIDVAMGIHTGYATVGFIGYEGRRDYGVIGSVTNLAARLSDAAGGGDILVSSAVREALPASIPLEPAGKLQLKGFARAQEVFRVRPES